MTWIKICGMTNLEDALVAVEAGADAVGFVFYEKSPRIVDPEVARKIVEKLPSNIEKVGVFVGETAQQMDEIAEQVGLTALQFYRSPSDSADSGWNVPRGSRKRIAAVSGGRLSNNDLVGLPVNTLYGVLIDSGPRECPGGTGETFDWTAASPGVQGVSYVLAVIIAGGLKPDNVHLAIDRLKPWGVDVSSGVEENPGKKDPDKVRAFVRAVRSADKAA
jgi:phosphoribosylanthranilate isomerase